MGEAQKESERKGVASFKGRSEPAGDSEQAQVVVTIDTSIGKVIKLEKIDKAGKHHELAEQEWAKLVGDDDVEEIVAALEEAFEAGIAIALGDEYEDDEPLPARRRILQRLMMRRMLRRWLLKGSDAPITSN